jgi:hypothetical protein
VFSPYVDVSVARQNLYRLARDSGAGQLTLAFVVADGHRCVATWGGGLPILLPAVRRVAARERIVASFGGSDGPDLARWCPTAAALAANYRGVIERLHASGADFDIEGSSLSDSSVIDRLAHAIAALEAEARASGRPITVSLTLPVERTGLTEQSLSVLRKVVSAGARVARVNLLAMDYGSSVRAGTPGEMGHDAIAAASAASGQLQPLFPAAGRRQIWQMLGITTMIGRNDVTSEVFTPTDAAEVLRFARHRSIGWLSFWSLTRDHRCANADPAQPVARDDCSGLRQSPFEFTRLFEHLAGQSR